LPLNLQGNFRPSVPPPEGLVLLPSRSNRELRLSPMLVRLVLVVLGEADGDSCAAL